MPKPNEAIHVPTRSARRTAGTSTAATRRRTRLRQRRRSARRQVIRWCPAGVGSAWVLDECQRAGLKACTTRRLGPRHDEPAVDEHRVLAFDRFDLAVRGRERDREVDACLLVPCAVDEADRGGIGAVPAI